LIYYAILGLSYDKIHLIVDASKSKFEWVVFESLKCKSLINNIKSKGAKWEPYGTSDGILKEYEI